MDALDDEICVPIAARASVRVSIDIHVDEDIATGAHSVHLSMTDFHPAAGRIEVFSLGLCFNLFRSRCGG
jgi:thiamine monophosphate synthase